MSNREIVPALLAWYAENARPLPWRRTQDPYAIWVSEIMLQQTQVNTVLPYWKRWMQAVPNIRALAKAAPEKLHKLWEGLGYYTRVRNMQKAAQLILQQHGGRFPENFDNVLALPGIGRYTAGAICSIAFDQPKPILDGNVIRVLARTFGISGNPRNKEINASLWRLAEQLVEQASQMPGQDARKTTSERGQSHHATGNTQHGPSHFNQSLMELGALICTPRQPQCALCPVAKYCVACQQSRIQEFPSPVERPRATSRRFIAFVAENRGRFLVRQRPPGVVNGHLWEFPNSEVRSNSAHPLSRHGTDRSSPVDRRTLLRAARTLLGTRPASLKPLCTIKHTITRYRITLEAFRIRGDFASSTSPQVNGRWLTRPRLRQLPFSSAHKKILQHL